MPLIVLVDREAKEEVGDRLVDEMMRVMDWSMEGYKFRSKAEGL